MEEKNFFEKIFFFLGKLDLPKKILTVIEGFLSRKKKLESKKKLGDDRPKKNHADFFLLNRSGI